MEGLAVQERGLILFPGSKIGWIITVFLFAFLGIMCNFTVQIKQNEIKKYEREYKNTLSELESRNQSELLKISSEAK